MQNPSKEKAENSDQKNQIRTIMHSYDSKDYSSQVVDNTAEATLEVGGSKGAHDQELESTDVEENPIQRVTTISLLDEIHVQRNRPFVRRNFSAMSKGGIRSSIFTLFSAAVGGGVLSLPKVMTYYGLVMGVTMIAGCGIFNYVTLTVLNDAVKVSGKKSYPNVASYFFGRKWAVAFAYMFLASNVSGCMVYPALVWGFVEDIFHKQLNLPIKNPQTQTYQEYSAQAYKWRSITLTGLGIAMLLINMRKEFSALRYASVFIMAIILLTILVSVAKIPTFYGYYSVMQDYEFNLWPTEVSWKWVDGFATIMFAYSCHFVFFYLRAELRHKTDARVKKVIRNTLVMEGILYLTSAITGYVSLGSKLCPDIFFLRKPIPGMDDDVMRVLRWLFIIVVVLHLPMSLFATRDQCYTLIGIKRNNKNHIILTLVLSVFSFGVPILYPDILGLISLIGGIFSFTNVAVVPLMLLIRIRETRGKNFNLISKVLIIMFVFMSLLTIFVNLSGLGV